MGVITIAGLLLVLSQSGSIVAAETIPAGESIVMDKLVVDGDEDPSHLSGLVSREARRTIYANQAVTMDNTRPRRIVARNQVVTLSYRQAGLEINLSGRAMGAAALGEQVQVMNLSTREMLSGTVQKDGSVLVQ